MATTSNRNLTLTTVDTNVTINVTYTATFTAFERQLAGLGMTFRERIRVLGVDPAGSTTGTVVANFATQLYPVTVGAGSQAIARNRSLVVTRASLQEDAGLGDADELRAQIEIEALGLPPDATAPAFTDQVVLLG